MLKNGFKRQALELFRKLLEHHYKWRFIVWKKIYIILYRGFSSKPRSQMVDFSDQSSLGLVPRMMGGKSFGKG